MATKFWTNQIVKMQSAIGAAQTITAISKAANGQVTTSGTPPTNGQYVLLTVTGMTQVNKRLFKASGVSGSNFNLGIDTQAFSDFVSGSFQVVTMGLAFSSLRDIQSSGGDPVYEDTTTIHDPEDTQAIVSSSPISYSTNADWDPSDAALKACNTAFVTRTPRCFSLGDPDGSEYLLNAYVNAPLNPTVSGKKKVTPISLAALAAGTAY